MICTLGDERQRFVTGISSSSAWNSAIGYSRFQVKEWWWLFFCLLPLLPSCEVSYNSFKVHQLGNPYFHMNNLISYAAISLYMFMLLHFQLFYTFWNTHYCALHHFKEMCVCRNDTPLTFACICKTCTGKYTCMLTVLHLCACTGCNYCERVRPYPTPTCRLCVRSTLLLMAASFQCQTQL